MQWIKPSTSISLTDEDGDDKKAANEEVVALEFVLGCMPPLDQADAAIVFPSPGALLTWILCEPIID
ncbi:MAG: hypothetical protein ACI90V_001966 [Bacillariaceae sp.]|jgi:hypothetical protein